MSTQNFGLLGAVLLASSLLAGCSPTNPNIRKSYDAFSDARVRVFVYSATRIRLDFDRDCYESPGFSAHGDGLETIQRFHSFQGSRSVGMPPTSKRSDAIYDEFIIKAGIPVTVFWQFGGTLRSGTGFSMHSTQTEDAGSFIPVAGKDYEIYGMERKGYVEDLGVEQGADTRKFVELTPAKACSASRIER
ncbi:hypothetical protein [Achromobacter xylosoxidans]|uniref:hypothetical protein n=2 Tax=Alcaligenes xylosoxydans xylosoxydans TaxID=85698 RepID=UPI0009EB6158|nr:hypothetical protein [Achromobacter xylosoxidans]MDH0524784.1 hypothetical protein [Achromobacter xylosoxidans]MDH0546275.1 hypothetical protein [Achromobacter xylosoxidans]